MDDRLCVRPTRKRRTMLLHIEGRGVVATFLRTKYAHHEDTTHGTRLQSWFVRADRRRDHEQALAQVVLETGKSLPVASSGVAKGRGVPIIGIGSGAIMGSSPDTVVPSRMDRLRERIGT